MKFGKVHLMRNRTWQHAVRVNDELRRHGETLASQKAELNRRVEILSSQKAELEREKAQHCRDSTELQRRLEALAAETARLGRRLELGSRHSFMHVMEEYTAAPGWILDPDDTDAPRTREAVGRVVEAYHRAMADFVAPGHCMWKDIEASPGKAEFFAALRRRDERGVAGWLTRLFRTDLVWGLGKVHESAPEKIATERGQSHFVARCTDALLSLAQACGARPVVSIQHQGFDAYQGQTNVDLDELLDDVERETGLDLSFPLVGAGYGCRIRAKLISIDSLLHSYTVHRLRQLGAGPPSQVVEIGGGYGCLAYLLHRAGLRNYEVFDLPWVNVLQGYFLIQSLPPGSVRLYGEGHGEVRVTPYWQFARRPDRSVDYGVNSDSLPEMALEDRHAHLANVRRTLRGCFLSINQESGVQLKSYDPQTGVGRLVEQTGGLRLLSRSLWWMCQGYVEEVFGPDDRGSACPQV
jgi:hypothetical protein